MQKNKTSFCLILRLGLGVKEEESNAYGVASAKILEISTHVLLSEIEFVWSFSVLFVSIT